MEAFGKILMSSVLFACAMICVMQEAHCAQSAVYLKGGRKMEGEIVSQDDKTVKLRMKYGTVTFDRKEIEKIETEEAAGEGEVGVRAADLRDEIVLKTGETMRGLIVSKDEKEIAFDVIMSGSGVSKTMLMRTTIDCRNVKELKELTTAQRMAARKYLESIEGEEERDAIGEQDLKVERDVWVSKDGRHRVELKKIELEHFKVESNAEEEFLRKASYRLAKVFDAYKDHFGVDRNEAEKVRVVIFNSMEEYYAAIEQQFMNPAFYAPELKLIAAGCDVAKYKDAIGEIRRHHEELNQQLEELRAELDQARKQVRSIVHQYYEQLQRSSGPYRDYIMREVRRQEREANKQLVKWEQPIKEIQEKIRQLNRRNDNVFDQYVSLMLQTLYHEGFHAFLGQFLFDEELVKDVPLWLNEGLAQYFEHARVEGPRLILGREDEAKTALLRKFHRQNTLIPLRKMITAGSKDYMVHKIGDAERSTKNYLQAWWLVRMLGEKGRLKKKHLDAFVKALAAGKSPEEALPILSGMTNDELEEEFKNSLLIDIRIE